MEKFCLDVEFMTGRRVTFYWRFCWGLVSPIFMTIVFIYSLKSMKPLQYGQEDYPVEYIVAGWCMFGIGALLTPLWCIYILTYKTKTKGFCGAFKESKYWGPRNEATRIEWLKFHEEARQRKEQIIRLEGHSWLKQKWYILCGKYQ